MLREHGAQRPTVFEILNHVHALRGSKPRFQYIALQKQSSVPRPLQPLSPNVAAPAPTSNPLDDLVTFKSRTAQSSPSKNAGVEARDKVLEAIAPMRRGRPGQQSATPEEPHHYQPPPSPRKEKERSTAGSAGFNLDMKFGAEEDKAWKGVRGHKSGLASIGGGTSVNLNTGGGGDAWSLGGKDAAKEKLTDDRLEISSGFDSNFSTSFGKGFGDAFEPSKALARSTSPSKPLLIPNSRPTPSPGLSGSPSKSRTSKDAFDGLGLSTQPPPPQTLGEARRARTGLATTGANAAPSTSSGQYLSAPGQGPGAGIGSSYTTYRPPSSQSPMPSPRLQPSSRPHSPVVSSSRAPSKPGRPGELTAEERFPSLEDLDRTFASPPLSNAVHASSQPALTEKLPERPTATTRPPSRGGVRTSNLLGLPAGAGPAPAMDRGAGRYDGVRSQHVTGTAMRDSRLGHNRLPTASDATSEPSKNPPRRSGTISGYTRPTLQRRHRSSISIKPTPSDSGPALVDVVSASNGSRGSPAPALPPRPSPKLPLHQKDWLTGASDDEGPSPPKSQPVLRESPSKRASFIERSPVQLEKPLEAESVVPSISGFEHTGERGRQWDRERQLERERERQKEAVRAHEREKELEKARTEEKGRDQARLVGVQKFQTGEKSRRQDTGRQSPTKATRAFATRTGTGTSAPVGGLQLPGMGPDRKPAPSPLVSADSGLTDNWSPISSPTQAAARRGSSSSDEGPEDINGYVPKGGIGEKINALKSETTVEPERREPERRRHAGKGRQNSVHDLVDLWGQQERVTSPTKLADKRRSAIVTSSSMMKPSYSSDQGPPRMSPPHTSLPLVSPTPVAPSPTPSTTRIAPRPPSAQQARKQTMLATGTSTRMPPSASPAPPAVPSTSSISAASTARARPQSMFINPVLKTAPLESYATPSSSVPKPDKDQPDAQRRSTRRTSISDMVQRYEAIGGGPRSPPVAAKPVPLSVKAISSESSSAGLPSPSTAVNRFPQLSPPSSPQLPKANLAVPEEEPSKRAAFQGRRSPSPGRAVSPRPLPGLAKFSEPVNGARSGGTSGRTSFERKVTLPPPEEAVVHQKNSDDGSPERPYQGVSKLIDRWQRVAEEAQGGTSQSKASGSVRGR